MDLNLLPAIQFPQNYTPPHSNPSYSWCCEQFSVSQVSWDFLAYLRNQPEAEIYTTKQIVLFLLQGTPFYCFTYENAIRGFRHLFCTNECFQKCAYSHVAFRQNYFWYLGDLLGESDSVTDIFDESGSNQKIPRLQFLSWKICSNLLIGYWTSKTLSAPYHYEQFLNLRRELSVLLPEKLEEVSILLTPCLIDPEICYESQATLINLRNSHYIGTHCPLTVNVLESLAKNHKLIALETYCYFRKKFGVAFW